MKYKITIYQQELTASIPPEDLALLKEEKPDFLCLPEYFFYDELISHAAALEYMKQLSTGLDCALIGGTAVRQEEDKLFNTSYLVDRGKLAGHYKKVNLYHLETGRITPGNEYKVFTLGPIRVGILICADVLVDESWHQMARLSPHLIFIPTFSPYKEESTADKFKRDEEIFVRGAQITGAVVVKVCGCGTFKTVRLQGRSLAAGPGGIIWRVAPEDEDKRIIKTLELGLDRAD